jgi:MinD superfamily P-loop ATPase
VIESIRDCDLVILVTEPTPFGFNDLQLAVDMVRALEIPLRVVINRAGTGDGEVSDYCRWNGIGVLAEIPDDRRIAEAYSRGELVCRILPEHDALFESILTGMMEGVC